MNVDIIVNDVILHFLASINYKGIISAKNKIKLILGQSRMEAYEDIKQKNQNNRILIFSILPPAIQRNTCIVTCKH